MFVYLIAWYVSHARAQELERSLLSEDLELPERARPGASAASAMHIVTVIHDCIDDSRSNSSFVAQSSSKCDDTCCQLQCHIKCHHYQFICCPVVIKM